ncbi:hypothetical protein V6L77_20240 [Pannonibacter sp. Pt2-lr]
MKYTRKDAKAHAFATMRGIWAAALMPFRADLSIDEDGFRANMNHWIDDLGIDGFFIAGKQESSSPCPWTSASAALIWPSRRQADGPRRSCPARTRTWMW